MWNSAVKIEVLQTGLANSVRFCVCQERFFDGFVDLASISSFVVFLIFRETVLLCRREEKTLPLVSDVRCVVFFQLAIRMNWQVWTQSCWLSGFTIKPFLLHHKLVSELP